MLKRITHMGKRAAAVLLAGLAAGCAYHGGGLDNPMARTAVWFSFVNGDDIRQACRPGSLDRVRLVYNGIWTEQVRIYEIGEKSPRSLEERVIGPNQLSVVSLSDPLAPWRGITGKREMTDQQYAGLMAALQRSGAFLPPDRKLVMGSDSFYWVAASCRNGVFVQTAWWFDPDPKMAVPFVAPLLALDTSGVAYNAPRPYGVQDLVDKPRADRDRWYLTVEPRGSPWKRELCGAQIIVDGSSGFRHTT
jgi:hypothetical protein